MNVELLLDHYYKSPSIFQLGERLLLPGAQKIFLKNLHGSSPEIVVSSVFASEAGKQLNHLVVLNDAEQAAYFQNTLENLTNALDIFYFPSSFKNRRNFKVLNSSHVMLRTEALTRFSLSEQTGVRKKIIVTYPEALFEKVVLPKTLDGNMIHLKANDTVSLDSLIELFVMYGFVRTDFVYEPGQFALRGGILDIYSFGNEKPYRVELFGNEVDSIRIFDPESQLSERKLSQVSIIPNIETQFDSSEKISLFDFLPDNTVVWLKDWDVIKKEIEGQEDDLQAFIAMFSEGAAKKGREEENDDDTKLLKKISPDDFVAASVIEKQIQQRHVVEFGYKPQMATFEIAFDTKPQPSFNRNFDMLIQNLKEKEAAGYSLYIFAEQARQLERLHSIFSDLNTEINFQPVVSSIHEGFVDNEHKVLCYTDHQIFQRYHKYRVKQAYNKTKALSLRALRELQQGDFVTHIDHGVGKYSGLQKIEMNGQWQEAVRIIYKDSDILYVNINSLHKISKYTSKEGSEPKINKLGSDVWAKLKEKTKSKVKEIAFDLIKLYAKRKAQTGFQFAPDNYMQTELEASFIYEETPDQGKAIADTKKDMEMPSPMDRLICGDVGFGKTEVAMRAAFKAVLDGKQVAILVPTTILAFQHYQTFSKRLKDFPVTIDFVNRFKSAKEKKEALQKLEAGKVDIIIGTHSLLGKEVRFKDLGLLVIDEEQKFGVTHKEKLKTFKSNVDCLTLTATPIPRTLQFSLMGARDFSIINTPPPNRQPIQTEVHLFNEELIREVIHHETSRGGQVFFIQNRIQGLEEMAGMIRKLCPGVSVAHASGKMDGKDLEDVLLDFIDHRYDVLVCTNIVESGVDISNVNTIIINNAHYFGLSDLHQLRGRVGRSNKKAFCYLLAPSLSTLPDNSRKRLQTLEQFSDLGSGFQIAMRDLDIRGAGNLLGGEQTGFMAEIGFEMYQKILDEAIRELKRSDFKDLFKEEIAKQDEFINDCTIDTDLEILLPDSYVANVGERLSLYTRLDSCENESDLQVMQTELTDRFGAIPPQVKDLFTTVRCRRIGVALGFEKMSLKEKTLRCYFINKPDSPYFESDLFRDVLAYVQTNTNNSRLKQAGKNFMLITEGIQSMDNMHTFLKKMHNTIFNIEPEVEVEEVKETGGKKKIVPEKKPFHLSRKGF